MTAATAPAPAAAAPDTARAYCPRLAPTGVLLTEGGDERIALTGGRAANAYGCTPLPDLGLYPFGSCTASTVSPAGFAAADALRHRLVRAGAAAPAAQVYAAEVERLRHELAGACGAAAVPGTELIIAASGTDLHLIAAALAGGAAGRPLLTIGAAAGETGRGVGAALGGRHYGTRCPDGRPVPRETRIAGMPTAFVQNLSLRGADGRPRPPALVDAEARHAAAVGVAAGRHVLLIVTDVSKTGLIAPSPDCAAELQARYGDRLTIMVDACQFRLAPATVSAYLTRGFMVAVTGSKFVGGPSFCGALLIPPAAARLREAVLPAALAQYSTRADWPTAWHAAARALPERANYGLLLRWEAALAELRTLHALPDTAVGAFLQGFAAAVQDHLARHPRLIPLPVAPLQRGGAAGAGTWDTIPTIFPFLIRSGDGVLDHTRAAQLHRRLARRDRAGPRFQLGQPVPLRWGDHHAAALRLCAGARTVVDALGAGAAQQRRIIDLALSALDALAQLAADH